MEKKTAIDLNTPISLTIKEIGMYSLFFITFGASVYTFYEAIPELKELKKITTIADQTIAAQNQEVKDLDKSVDDLKTQINIINVAVIQPNVKKTN